MATIPNISITKPVNFGSKDVWGTILNTGTDNLVNHINNEIKPKVDVIDDKAGYTEGLQFCDSSYSLDVVDKYDIILNEFTTPYDAQLILKVNTTNTLDSPVIKVGANEYPLEYGGSSVLAGELKIGKFYFVIIDTLNAKSVIYDVENNSKLDAGGYFGDAQDLKDSTGNKYTFDTVADLQASDITFVVGDIVCLLGHSVKGDGRGHHRKIENINKNGADLGGGLYANPIPLFTGEVFFNWYDGVVSDGTTDISTSLQNVIDNSGYKNLCFDPNFEYTFANLQLSDSNTIDCKDATIKPYGNNPSFLHSDRATIKNVRFKGTGKSGANTNETGIGVGDTQYWSIQNVYAEDLNGGIIILSAVQEPFLFSPRIISNIVANNCNIGIDFGQKAEYALLSNISISKTNEPINITAGNIICNNGVIVDCVNGIHVKPGANDAHGHVSGFEINHCTNPIIVDNINTKAFNFSNINVYYGNIHLNECEGVVFSDCQISLVTVLEEGAKNCWFKDCHFFDTMTFNYNYNSKPSSVIYDNIIETAGISGDSGRRNKGGYLELIGFKADGGGYTVLQGESKILVDPTIFLNMLGGNSNYTVKQFYDQANDRIRLMDNVILNDYYCKINASFSLYSATDFNPLDVDVFLYNELDTFDRVYFTPVRQHYSAAYIKTYSLDTQIMRKNWKLMISNRSSTDISFPTTQVLPNQLFNNVIVTKI